MCIIRIPTNCPGFNNIGIHNTITNLYQDGKGGKKGPVGVHLDGLGHVVVDDQWHVLDVDTYEEKSDLFFTKIMWWTDKTNSSWIINRCKL